MADAKKAPKKQSAQNIRPTISGAINRFVTLINDREIVFGGQFVWSNHYDRKLRELVVTLVGGDANLLKLWFEPRATLVPATNRKSIRDRVTPPAEQSLLDDLIEVSTAPVTRPNGQGNPDSRQEFSVVRRAALADPSMNTGTPQVRALIRLLNNNREGDGESIFNQCNAKIRAGIGVPRDRAVFNGIFLARKLSFKGALRLNEISQEKCFDTVDAICGFIANNGGLSTRKAEEGDSSSAVTPSNVPGFGQVFFRDEDFGGNKQGLSSGIRRFAPPLFDLVRFTDSSNKQNLEGAVDIYRKALDQGHLLRAGVVSGINAENPTFSPDHFICLLAWERRLLPDEHTVFAFWDPDGLATADIGQAFGRIFFMRGDIVQKRAQADADQRSIGIPGNPVVAGARQYDASFYANCGRLTTAFFESELRCDFAGDFVVRPERPKFPLKTPLPASKTNHRYQVTTVEVNAGFPLAPKPTTPAPRRSTSKR